MTRAASAGSWFYSASNGSSSVEPYSIQENGFNIFGDPSSETYTIPATTATTGLSGTYSFVHFWTTTTGIPLGQKYPAVTAAGLPLETTQLTYLANPIDLVSGLGGTVAGYAASTSYDAFGDVTDEEIGSGTTNLTDINSTYDAHTLRLKDQLVQRHAVTPPTSANVDEEAYNYDPYGNLTSQVSTRLGSASQVETQCFRYDGLDQLTQAWTASDACKTTPTTSSHSQVTDGITGGAYWTTWNYDTTGGNAASDILGEMTSQVQHSLTGGTDTTTTNTFGGANGGPHALTTAATTGGSTSTSTFKYDAAGNMTTRAVPSAGTQALTWNAAGQLTSVSAGAGKTTSYVYAPDGSLLLQEDPGATTLYLDGEQLTATTSGTTTTVTGARIIPLPVRRRRRPHRRHHQLLLRGPRPPRHQRPLPRPHRPDARLAAVHPLRRPPRHGGHLDRQPRLPQQAQRPIHRPDLRRRPRLRPRHRQLHLPRPHPRPPPTPSTSTPTSTPTATPSATATPPGGRPASPATPAAAEPRPLPRSTPTWAALAAPGGKALVPPTPGTAAAPAAPSRFTPDPASMTPAPPGTPVGTRPDRNRG